MFEIYYKDVAPLATISVTSETATFERRFLIDQHYETRYQSNGSSTLLNFDLGAIYQISGAIVLNSNVTGAATTFNFRSGSTAALTDPAVAMSKEKDSVLLHSANRRYYGIDIVLPAGNVFVGKVIFFQSHYSFDVALDTARGNVSRFIDVTNTITGAITRKFVNHKFTGDFQIPKISLQDIKIADESWQQPYVVLSEPHHGIKYGTIDKTPDFPFFNDSYRSFFTFQENR